MSENIENVNGNHQEANITKKGPKVKKEKKPTEQELMILQLAQAVQNLTAEIAELKKGKAAPVEEQEDAESDEPIRVSAPKGGMMAVKPKSNGKKYGAAQSGRFYKFVTVPGDDSDFQRQAKKCMVVLTKAAQKLGEGDDKLLSEAVAMKCLRQYQQFISDNQDAWRVFAFYRARLIEAGYVVQLENYAADISELE